MKKPDIGLTGWQHATNHNRMIDFQQTLIEAPQVANNPSPETSRDVQLTFFGSSAFRITSPSGITIMVDPWRNHPSGKWD